MSTLTLKDVADLFERYYIPPANRIATIYVWEGSKDSTSSQYWRNRPLFKNFLEAVKVEKNEEYNLQEYWKNDRNTLFRKLSFLW